jgi:transmembrane sensor
MDNDRMSYLLREYAAGTASKDEVREMFELLKSAENADVLRNLVVKEGMENNQQIQLPQQQWDDMWMSVASGTVDRRKRRVVLMQWTRVAAAVLVMVAAGLYFFTGSKKEKTGQPVAEKGPYKNDVAPGGNKAILTLADGSTIVLDSATNGLIAQQGNTGIRKVGGQIVYDAGHSPLTADHSPVYNTISTPRGGQYQMVLPDGSRVWLNASSSIRFPATFPGHERRVELTGEAYFEIAHRYSATGKKAPFIVHVNAVAPGKSMDVEVTGTHFNVMAYPNEQGIKTTLLEGQVRVSVTDSRLSTPDSRLLLPGQQAQATNNKLSVLDNVNVDQVVAWKNGYFRFKGTGIRELMRQAERWYDVEVEYQTTRSDQDYTGIVSRSQNLSSLLQMLELTGTVHFRVEGRKIIVLP